MHIVYVKENLPTGPPYLDEDVEAFPAWEIGVQNLVLLSYGPNTWGGGPVLRDLYDAISSNI